MVADKTVITNFSKNVDQGDFGTFLHEDHNIVPVTKDPPYSPFTFCSISAVRTVPSV